MSESRASTQSTAAGVFSAADIKRRMAEREAAKAEGTPPFERAGGKAKAVMDEFHKPLERTPEQLTQVVMQLVSHAAERGQSEVQVYRFPNSLCSDRGQRISNSEPDWEASLDGRPKFAYEFWHDHLRPLGFHLKAEVLEYPGGMLGDIGFILAWK